MSDLSRSRAPQPRVVATVTAGDQPTWQFIAVVFGGIFAILTAGFFGYQALSTGSIQWRSNVESPTDWGGYKNHLRAFLPIEGVAPQMAKYNTELRKKCVAPESTKRYSGLPRMVDYNSGRLELDLQDGQRFLACVIDNEYQRLCQNSERRQVILGLKKVAEMHHEESVLRRASASRVPSPFLAAMQKSAEMSGVDNAFVTSMAIDPSLAAALKKASAYGFVKASDFGGNVPPEFSAFIVPVKSDACR